MKRGKRIAYALLAATLLCVFTLSPMQADAGVSESILDSSSLEGSNWSNPEEDVVVTEGTLVFPNESTEYTRYISKMSAQIDETFSDLVKHLVLPGFSLAILRVAEFLRYSRASMLEVLHSDYMWTARSKGISEFRVISKHALGNALIPIITLIGINIPVLFSGAIMIEQLFQWPGIGTLFNLAVSQRDHSLLMGLCFFSSTIVLVSNLLTDIAYAAVDPRIRYE